MSHIIQRNLAAEIEWISSFKFLTTQNFQVPTVIKSLDIMLLLFTTFRYLPNFIFSRKTAHLIILQKTNVIWAVSIISPTGYNIIWYARDERKSFFPFSLNIVLVEIVPASLERFTFFLIGLIDLDDSAIFIFWLFFKRFIYV